MDAGGQFPPNPADPELVAHERTYKYFNILMRWCMTLLAATISFLTLWFATKAGFLGGLVVGLIVFAVGYAFLVKHEERQPLDVWRPGR
jgi:hypothetical protein